MHYLAIEIGGTKLQLHAGTGDGTIVDRVRFDVNREAGGEGIRAQIAQALPELIGRWNPAAIGVGFGGPVRWSTGEIAKSHHVEGWSDFPLAAWLRERTGLPAFVENDANAAAFGEALHGAGKGSDPVFYVTLGSGVGGGFVMGGAIFHGTAPGEVEIGHIRLDRNGTIVENRCSGWALDRRVREEVDAHRGSILACVPGEGAHRLGAALAAGCPIATSIAGEHAATLAFALSHVVHLLHPQVIIIGGGLSLLGEALRSRVAAGLPHHVMEAFHPCPHVALAALGEDSVPVGALALAARSV
jgi:glucokinase